MLVVVPSAEADVVVGTRRLGAGQQHRRVRLEADWKNASRPLQFSFPLLRQPSSRGPSHPDMAARRDDHSTEGRKGECNVSLLTPRIFGCPRLTRMAAPLPPSASRYSPCKSLARHSDPLQTDLELVLTGIDRTGLITCACLLGEIC